VSHVLSIIFGAVFTIFVSRAIGRLLFRWLGITLHRFENDLLSGAAGAAILSFAVFLLCALNAARTPVFLLMGVAALGANWRWGSATAGSRLPALPPRWKLLFWTVFTASAVLYLSNSLAPEISPDGQVYHLGLVYRYFREHGFHRITTNMYASMPEGTEMLFLFAFAFGRHSAAATVHCCYLLALPLLMLSYGRRIGRPGVAVCAALIAGLSPVVGIDGVSAYNDVALATSAFAMFYLLEIWRERSEERRDDALLIPIGLLAGFCYAIKMTGFVAPVYAVVVILMRRRPRALFPVAAMAAMMILPWMIKDWLWLGNPVSPFYNRVFRNPWIHVQFEDDLRAWFTHDTLTSFRPWFGAVTLGGELGGQVGPIFLLSPFALLALRSRAGRHCLLAGLFFLIPYPQNIGARFLIPAVPFFALAIALAFEFSQVILATLVVVAAVAAWPRVIDKYRAPAGGWQIAHMPWKAALRIVPQDVFLGQSVAWISAQMLDYYVPAGKRVWSTTPVAEAYAKTDVMISYQSAEGELLEDFLTTATRDNLAPAWNLRFTFPKHRMRHLRLVQTARNAGDIWSIGEVKIFDGSNQILSTPEWRIGASPFPWDVALAFDGNPVTRWRSWESIHPGMHVDVDFGSLVEIDRVELHGSHDQSNIEVHPEVCDGRCTIIAATLDKLEDPPYGDLRKLATRKVKERGIDYLLIDDSNWTAADMNGDPNRWGLEFIAGRAGNRLYKIQ
jgi:hypothetical protein